MVGIVIGSGIFATPTTIARNMGSPTLILSLWVAGGLIALCGALTFAELNALLPRTGGTYVFLREGFGPCPAFVFGWTYLLIAKPSAAGAITSVFSTHFQSLTGLNWSAPLLACVVLFILTVINVLGVRGSARFAIALTGLKYAAIGAIIVLGVSAALRGLAGGQSMASHFVASEAPRTFFHAIVPVMAGIMWTYDGWADVSSIAGEIENPQRTLPRVYAIGTIAVIALYVLANAVYLWHLPLADMRRTETVAPMLVTRLAGPAAMSAVTLLIILSTLGSSHGGVMTGARVTFAQAQDGLLFRFLGKVSPRYQTPAVSLWTEYVLSCAMILFLKDFQSLAESFVFTIWIFYGMAAISVFILRARLRDTHRSFRVPGYPYVPAIFILTSATMTVLSILNDWKTTGLWLLVLIAGVPVYYVWRWLYPTPS
jgi:amino acid transporter